MPIIKLTPSDILKGKLIDAGWYGAKIVKVAEDWVPSSDKQSTNLAITFEILGTGGKELDVIVNSKGLGFVAPLISAIENKEIKPEAMEIDTSKWTGKMVDVQVIQDTYQGRLNNKITGYLPHGKGKSAQTY
jgi:hypothetical protein